MSIQWIDIRDLNPCGKGWNDTARPYDRLPARAEGVATEAVWDLSRQSAGMYVDFRSNASSLHARCKLWADPGPDLHYIKYLDLYACDGNGAWRWAGVSRNGFMPTGETPLVEGIPAEWRTWRLYLPLSYEVERLEIGIPEEAGVQPVPADTRKAIVVYGTSIVHGMRHVSRPGMAWTSIVGRQLDWPLVNLGFSGVARMEPPLGEVIAELDPAIFVIDPLANMGTDTVAENAEPFMRAILKAHPETPVLMMDDRTHADAWLRPDYLPQQEIKQAAFRRLADALRAEGFPIHTLSGKDLIGQDGEATTDASHPSDLGAMRYAEVVTPVLREIVEREKREKRENRDEEDRLGR